MKKVKTTVNTSHLNLSFDNVDENTYSVDVCQSVHMKTITKMMKLIESALTGDIHYINAFKEAKSDITVEYLQQQYISMMKDFTVVHERHYAGTEFDQSRYGTREERLIEWINSKFEAKTFLDKNHSIQF